MSKELVISATSHERRVAILEEGQLVEIYIEREKEFALVGSIYKGKVTRVLPGMQSAFVDIGLDGDAFLYVSDVFENLEDYEHGHAHGEPSAPAPVGNSRLLGSRLSGQLRVAWVSASVDNSGLSILLGLVLSVVTARLDFRGPWPWPCFSRFCGDIRRRRMSAGGPRELPWALHFGRCIR